MHLFTCPSSLRSCGIIINDLYMGRKKAEKPEDLLSKTIVLRVTEGEFQRYETLAGGSNARSIAEVIRRQLAKQQLIVYQKDTSLDGPMEALLGLEKELNYIGHNINQLTRAYNASPYESQQEFYLQRALHEYQKISERIDTIKSLIAQLSAKWLQK